MQETAPVITIKAIARHHAKTLMVNGLLGLILSGLLANFFWWDFRLHLVLLLLVSLILLIIGAFKHFEPVNSFELTPQYLCYFHRYGACQLAWDNIQRIDIPVVTQGIEAKPLAYIGIRLKNPEVLAQLPRRLANNLLSEQRDLYFLACQLNHIGLLERQINDQPFRLSNKQLVIGPVGAFLHRSTMLAKTFGYELFIPFNACDREPQKFLELLKQCQEYATQRAA